MPEINTPSDRSTVEGQPPSPSNKAVVDQAVPSPPAAVAASDFKYGAGSHVSVEVLGSYGRGRRRRSALAMILLLFVASLVQAVLASAIRRQVSRDIYESFELRAKYASLIKVFGTV